LYMPGIHGRGRRVCLSTTDTIQQKNSDRLNLFSKY
jgi:hypothetical protein